MNPIVEFRKEHDLSRKELALVLNESYSTITAVENGSVKTPKKLFELFEETFNDVSKNELLKKYKNFRSLKRKKLLTKINEGGKENK
jgi:DNA-binding XRE family transcriptional regulator